MKPVRFAGLLFLGMSSIAAPAFAWPIIDVTAIETLSVDPPLYRTSFAISSAGYNPGITYQYFDIVALDPATLHLQDPVGPPGWTTGPCTDGDTGCVFFSALWGEGAPVPAVITGSIVSDQSEPCVRIQFFDPVILLAKTPAPVVDANFAVEMCLVLDAPGPALPISWGGLKSTYR